jgi:DNA-binding transcriptional LysR family regulator
MNLRQLECFRAVMVTGTMTRAAELLRVSQPSISNVIAALEHEIGFSLFKRRKGRLQPTSEAAYFYEEAIKTLESLDNTVRTAQEIRNMNTGRLVVASQPGIAVHFLPMVVSKFLETHPDVQFKLLSRSSAIVREMISTQQFDIGIAEPPVEHPGVRTERISAECVCVLPAGHRLSSREVITPTDLDGEPFISIYKDHSTYYRLSNAFADAKARWKVIAETHFFSTCCSFVENGSGVTISDPYTASRYTGSGLVIKPFRPRINYELDILFPLDRSQSKILDAFVDCLKQHIPEYTEPSYSNT